MFKNILTIPIINDHNFHILFFCVDVHTYIQLTLIVTLIFYYGLHENTVKTQ